MIEEDMYQHLEELGIDVYPQHSETNILPYLVYSVVTGGTTTAPAGSVRFVKTVWQIDVYDDSAYKAKQHRELVVEKIRDFSLQSGEIEWRDGYEPRVKTFRQIIEFETKQYIGECNGN